MVLDYKPILPDIQSINEKHANLLKSSPQIAKIFSAKSVFPAYRQTKTLTETYFFFSPFLYFFDYFYSIPCYLFNLFIYLFIYLFLYLFIYLFIYLYLFIFFFTYIHINIFSMSFFLIFLKLTVFYIFLYFLYLRSLLLHSLTCSHHLLFWFVRVFLCFSF